MGPDKKAYLGSSNKNVIVVDGSFGYPQKKLSNKGLIYILPSFLTLVLLNPDLSLKIHTS